MTVARADAAARAGLSSSRPDNAVPLTGDAGVPLPVRAQVAVIGGGIVGVAVAHALAEAGVSDVVVLERNRLGAGSSAKPLGGVRAAFSETGNIVLGQRSRSWFESFADRFGADIGLRRVGYLFLARTDEELVALEASSTMQRELGNEARMVSPLEAEEINPFLAASALRGAAFTPNDGYVEPARVVAALARAAEERGVQISEHTEVLAVDRDLERITVHTQRGQLQADAVVIAAGAWSAMLGDQLGVPLPVEPVRRQIGLTAQRAGMHPTVPFTLDLSTTMYFHNYRDGMLLGISNDEPPGFNREFSYGWVPEFDRAAATIAPALAHAPLVAGWAGLYENTPDHNAMIGCDRSAAPVFYATGFSGHGLLQAPAAAELIRDLFLDRKSFIDPAPFSATRFAGGRPTLSELHII